MTEDLQPGEFAEQLPPKKKRDRTGTRVDHYGLDAMALLAQQRPGVPLLAGRSIPKRYTNAIRARRRDPYITEDGRIQVAIRKTGLTEDYTDDLCDVWFTWEQFPELHPDSQ